MGRICRSGSWSGTLQIRSCIWIGINHSVSTTLAKCQHGLPMPRVWLVGCCTRAPLSATPTCSWRSGRRPGWPSSSSSWPRTRAWTRPYSRRNSCSSGRSSPRATTHQLPSPFVRDRKKKKKQKLASLLFTERKQGHGFMTWKALFFILAENIRS